MMGSRSPRGAAAALAVALALGGLLAWLGWSESVRQAATAARAADCRRTLTAVNALTASLAEAAACRCAFLPRAEPAALARFQTAAAAARSAMGNISADVVGLAERQLAALERSVHLRQNDRFADRRQLELTQAVADAAAVLAGPLAEQRERAEREADGGSDQGWTTAHRATAAACLAGMMAALGLGLAGAAAAGGHAARREADERALRLAETRAALDSLAALQAGLERHFNEAGRLASVGRVTSEVVHDFNNLLGVILACSETTLQGLPADHPAREVLGQAVEAGHRAAALSRRVLSVGRGQPAAPCSLNDVIADLAPILRRVAGPNVEARLELADGLPPVLADRSRLEQVLLNLTANARDAMPDGGSLTIRTAADGGRVVLSVADSGVGMDAATKARVFEAFFSTKAEGKGTGLGMAIVRGAVDDCGGRVEVDSEPGRGTCVRVYLKPASVS